VPPLLYSPLGWAWGCGHRSIRQIKESIGDLPLMLRLDDVVVVTVMLRWVAVMCLLRREKSRDVMQTCGHRVPRIHCHCVLVTWRRRGGVWGGSVCL
jgi:hypothetical protein